MPGRGFQIMEEPIPKAQSKTSTRPNCQSSFYLSEFVWRTVFCSMVFRWLLSTLSFYIHLKISENLQHRPMTIDHHKNWIENTYFCCVWHGSAKGRHHTSKGRHRITDGCNRTDATFFYLVEATGDS